MVNAPTIGQSYRHPYTGQLGIIIAVYGTGTMDVEMPDGRCYRVTGLPFARRQGRRRWKEAIMTWNRAVVAALAFAWLALMVGSRLGALACGGAC